jgi:predicted AlkP superfamily phosphohydrolase/phosphomutase
VRRPDRILRRLAAVGALRRLVVVVALVAVAVAWASPRGVASEHDTRTAPDGRPAKRVLILGFDGFDPDTARRLIAAGRLPNLARLAETGSLTELATSMPPQSPVAWSEFAVGAGAEVHGIFDFLHRDPRDYRPVSSLGGLTGGAGAVELGGLRLPLQSPTPARSQRGEPFWSVLLRHDVPATMVACPMTFPAGAGCCCISRTISGMGTPDLLGSTFGRYSYFVEAGSDADSWQPSGFSASAYPTPPDEAGPTGEPAPASQELITFDEHDRATARLVGPIDPFAADGTRTSLPLTIAVDRESETALVRLAVTAARLRVGEWSGWVPICFESEHFGLGGGFCGQVKLLLRSADPVRLYVSPVNIDPVRPAGPIGTPDPYTRELAEALGRFYTETIPEDVAALEEGALDRREFSRMIDAIKEERARQLAYELKQFRDGLLFVYFSGSDIVQHTFYREATAGDLRDLDYHDTIDRFYAACDGVVGQVLSRLGGTGSDTWLMVLSDHGFAPFRRTVDVNRRLIETGYLVLKPGIEPAGARIPADVDWSRTRAYGMGINAVYANIAGREGQGIVAPADVPALLDAVRADLMALRDPATDESVLREVYRTADLYPGADPARAPDLLLGWRRGYRTGWASAEGAVGPGPIVNDNTRHWSGDHCMDWREVPGVIFTSRPLAADAAPRLRDIGPSILHWYGITPPAAMTGKPQPFAAAAE